jgi:hypothetical protein
MPLAHGETAVLNLWLMLLVVTVSLMVLFWVGTLFLQSWIYTEATPGLAWQAPAAGAVMGGFFSLWCLLIAKSPDANPSDIPYDALHRFSARVDMVKKPVPELWAVKKNEEKVKYVAKAFADLGQTKYEYRDSKTQRPWNPSGVKAIELTHDGVQYRFEPSETETGAYPIFVSDTGWRLRVFDSGPTGIPEIFRTGRFLANLLLNFLHLALWFVCLWLLVRFQWSHALGFAFCLWLLFTLALLPLMLDYAARVPRSPVGG